MSNINNDNSIRKLNPETKYDEEKKNLHREKI